MIKKLFSDGVIALIGKIFTLASTLFVAVIITRKTNLEISGAYFFVMSVVMFSTILGRMGLETSALKYVARFMALNEDSKSWETYKFTYKKVILQSFLASFFVILSIKLSNFNFTNKEIFYSVLFGMLYTHQYYYFEAIRGFGSIFLAVVFGGTFFSITSLLIFLILVANETFIDLELVLLILVICSFLNILCANIAINTVFRRSDGELNTAEKKDIVSTATPIGFKSIFGFFLKNGDIWLLSFFVSPAEVSLYGAATRLVFVINFLLQIINIIVSPEISKLSVQNRQDELEQILRGSAFPATVFAGFIVVIFLLYGENLLQLMFGSEYGVATQVLVILTVGKLANALTGSCGYVLLMTGEQKFALISVAITSFFTLIIATKVVGIYGIEGVAATFSIGLFIQQLSLFIRAKQKSGINTFASYVAFKELIKKW